MLSMRSTASNTSSPSSRIFSLPMRAYSGRWLKASSALPITAVTSRAASAISLAPLTPSSPIALYASYIWRIASSMSSLSIRIPSARPVGVAYSATSAKIFIAAEKPSAMSIIASLRVFVTETAVSFAEPPILEPDLAIPAEKSPTHWLKSGISGSLGPSMINACISALIASTLARWPLKSASQFATAAFRASMTALSDKISFLAESADPAATAWNILSLPCAHFAVAVNSPVRTSSLACACERTIWASFLANSAVSASL